MNDDKVIAGFAELFDELPDRSLGLALCAVVATLEHRMGTADTAALLKRITTNMEKPRDLLESN